MAEVLHARHTCEILVKSNHLLKISDFRGWGWSEKVPYEMVQLDDIISLSQLCLSCVYYSI